MRSSELDVAIGKEEQAVDINDVEAVELVSETHEFGKLYSGAVTAEQNAGIVR
mgnify:CR=1 FL=1